MIKIIIGFVLGVFAVSIYLQTIIPEREYELDAYEFCRYKGFDSDYCYELLKD